MFPTTSISEVARGSVANGMERNEANERGTQRARPSDVMLVMLAFTITLKREHCIAVILHVELIKCQTFSLKIFCIRLMNFL